MSDTDVEAIDIKLNTYLKSRVWVCCKYILSTEIMDQVIQDSHMTPTFTGSVIGSKFASQLGSDTVS